MAGIFESQTIGGSSLKGESFIQQPTVYDPSQALTDIGNSLVLSHGKRVVEQAKQDVTELESGFLNSTAQNREDEATLDQLRKIDPSQTMVYQEAAKQIKDIQSTINQRGVNPANALSKRDAIISRAMARAPLFKQQLRSLTTDSSFEFQSEAEQMIKETNAVRDEMVSLDLDPDIPTDIREYQEYKAAERNATYFTNRTKVNSAQAAASIRPAIDKYLKSSIGILEKAMVKGGADFNNLSTQDRSAIITELQQFTNGNEINLAYKLLQRVGINPIYVEQDVIDNAAKMIKGRAEYLIKAYNGSIPKELAEYEVDFSKNEVLLNLKDSNSGTFAYVALLPYIKDSIAGTGIEETGANDIKKYLTFHGLGNMDMTTLSGMKSSGISNPRQTQNLYADGLSKSMDAWMQLDPEMVDSDIFEGQMKNIIKDINYMTSKPDEFTPKMFDIHIAKLNNSAYMKEFENLSPILAKEYSDGVRNSIVSYVRQKMAKDINDQLNKERGLFKTRELVTPVINPVTGNIRFQPNSSRSERFSQLAEQASKDLNKMYGTRFDSIQLAGKNYGKLPTAESEGHFMKLMFNDMFQEVGDPIRTVTEDVDETNRRANIKAARSQGLKVEDNATSDEILTMIQEVRKEEQFNKELERIQKQRTPFSSQYKESTDVFADAIQQALNLNRVVQN